MNYTPTSSFDFTGMSNYTPVSYFDFTEILGELIPSKFGQAWPIYLSNSSDRTVGQLWPTSA